MPGDTAISKKMIMDAVRDGRLKEKELDFEKIDEVCHYIPSGKNVWEGRE